MLSYLKATSVDLDATWKLFLDVKKGLESKGDYLWSDNVYPSFGVFNDDIIHHRLYLVYDGDSLIGSYSLTYELIKEFFPKTKNPKKLAILEKRVGQKLDGNFVLLHRLMVRPSYQNKGTGALILKHIEESEHKRFLLGLIAKDNVYRLNFYLKNGYIDGGVHNFEYRKGYRQWRFIYKDINV